MESEFNKTAMTDLAFRTVNSIGAMTHAPIVLALIEIREVIEQLSKLYASTHTAPGYEVTDLERLDQEVASRLEKLEARDKAICQQVAKIATLETSDAANVNEIRSLGIRVVAVEKAIVSLMENQSEAARLLLELSEKIQGNVPAAGPNVTKPHLDSPTAG